MPTSISRRSLGGIVAVLIGLVLVVGLAGCSGTGRVPTDGGGTGGETESSSTPGDDTATSAVTDPAHPNHVSADLPPHDPEVVVESPEPSFPVTVETVNGEVTVEKADRILTLDRAGALSRMVWAMGLGDRLVGRDTASDFPAIEALPQVTPGGHAINAETVLQLRPDLVITDGSIGPSRVLQTLADTGVAVVEVDGDRTPTTVGNLVRAVATTIGLGDDADEVVTRIEEDIAAASADAREHADGRRMMILYLRGTSVAMIAGPESGGGELIEMLGGVDAAADIGIGGSFTNLTPEALVRAEPDTVIVMTQGLDSIGGPEGLNSLPGMAQTPAGANGSVLDVPDSQLLSFGPETARVIRAMAQALYGDSE